MTSDQNIKSCLNELSSFEIFQSFSKDEICDLCHNGQIKFHKHRDILFQLGEPAFYFGVVLTGAYKLSRFSPAGDESVIHFCTPGDVIAALVMPQKSPTYPVQVKAMGPSRVLILPQSNYVEKWINHPELIVKVQGLLSNRMTRLQSIKTMQRSPLSSKIANLLLQLALKEDLNQDSFEIKLPLTRREIADSLGATVESVIRIMSDWEKKEIIITTDQFIKINKTHEMILLSDQADIL